MFIRVFYSFFMYLFIDVISISFLSYAVVATNNVEYAKADRLMFITLKGAMNNKSTK